MRKFLANLWQVVVFPFRFIFNIIAFPFRMITQFNRFLSTEPDEHSLSDVFVGLASSADARQTIWDHVDEFRMHLLRALLVLILMVCSSFFFTQQIMDFLAQPIGGLSQLRSIDATETIGVFMKVALFAGLALAIPYIVFELWLFAAPGLRPRERKMGLAGIPLALIFFISGAAFTYYAMLPTAMDFLINFMGVKTDLRPQSYYSLVIGLMFWIGVFFEFPLVIYVLTAIGFVKPKVLAEQWRLAIVIITIIAAVITPTVDPINQGLVMAPMIMLYFISIGLSHLAYAGRTRNESGDKKKAEEITAS
jgi:sec-independent protein translocase protein TatC